MAHLNPAGDEDVVLITGASTGLGLALAKLLLAETRYRLVLTARQSSLHRFADEGIVESERVLLRPLDVTIDAERRAVVNEVEHRWGGVDILVNNAGLAYRSVLEHVDEDERIAQVHVNFRGPIGLAALVLPGMRARRHGRILNVSSVGGMMAMPTMSIYSASKWALEGATEALWYEVRPWGVRVSLIEPGFIRSSGFERTQYTVKSRRSAGDPGDDYHAHYTNMQGFIARMMQRSLATPETVARVILRTMRQADPPLRVLATLDAHLFAALRRFLPRGLYHRLLYAMLPHIRRWGPRIEEAERPQLGLL